MANVAAFGFGALAGLLTLASALQEQPQRLPTRQTGGVSSATQPVSPVAMATWLTRDGSNRSELDLVVIWRGAPGWFLSSQRGSQQGESSGGRAGLFWTAIKFGDLRLDLSLTSTPRVVSIQDRSLPIPDKNVVLVDHADNPTNHEIVSTLTIDPTFVDQRIGPVLGRSPEIVAFLRCDVRLGRPVDGALQKLCADIIGREASRGKARRP